MSIYYLSEISYYCQLIIHLISMWELTPQACHCMWHALPIELQGTGMRSQICRTAACPLSITAC